MSTRTYYGNNGGGKLIRDGILLIMDAKRVKYSYRVATEDEFPLAAATKSVEELTEVFEALAIPDPVKRQAALITELADFDEINRVVKANNPFYSSQGIERLVAQVMKQEQITPEEVEQVRLERLKSRGGFERRLILEWTEK